jgi:hypothetical protein
VGTDLTVGSSPVTVTALGRICVSGNSGSHTIEFVNASTGAAVSGGTVTLSMSGCQAGQFAYASLSSPITLPSGGRYYLVSSETAGGDQWYDAGELTSTAVAAVTNAAYSTNGTSWIPDYSSDWSFGPVNFEYSTSSNGSAFVATYNLNNPVLRNNFTGYVGTDLTIGASAVTVTALGRICVSGNSGSHTIEFVNASTGAAVSGGTVTLSMSGCQAGQFAYASLSSPITLPAGGRYYLASSETVGGDQWYDAGTLTSTAVAAVTNAAYSSDGKTWIPDYGPDWSFGPVNFEYSGTSNNNSSAFVLTYNLNNPALRNNFTGYVGTDLTVGSSAVTVTALGRICVSGNSGSHTLEFVNASTGAAVSGGTVTLSMSGCQAGQFSYANLSSPITLAAGVRYYLVSSETAGGDQWYDAGELTSTAVAAVTNAAYSTNGTSWIPDYSSDWSFGPVNFEYSQ